MTLLEAVCGRKLRARSDVASGWTSELSLRSHRFRDVDGGQQADYTDKDCAHCWPHKSRAARDGSTVASSRPSAGAADSAGHVLGAAA